MLTPPRRSPAIFAIVLVLVLAGCGRRETGGEIPAADPAYQPKLRFTVDGSPGPVAFSHDSKTLAVGCHGPLTKLIDVAGGKERATLKRPERYPPSAIVFHPKGQLVATAWGENVILWDTASGEQKAVFPSWSGIGMVYSLTFDPTGKLLAAAGRNTKETGEVRLWNVETGQQIAELSEDPNVPHLAEFSSDGKALATTGYAKTLTTMDPKRICSVKVWDLASLKTVQTYSGPAEGVGDSGRMAAASVQLRFSGDHSILVLGRWGPTMKLWDATTGQARVTFAGKTSWVVSSAFNTNGARLASGSFDGVLRIWDAVAGRELASTKAHDGWVMATAIDRTGTILATSGGPDRQEVVKVWDLPGGR